VQVSVDVSNRILSLTADNDSNMDEDELIRVNYIIDNSKRWYLFWKKSPNVELIMSGENNAFLKTVKISF